MYRITFKGNSQPILIEDKRAIALLEDMEKGIAQNFLRIDNRGFDTRSIKAIEPATDEMRDDAGEREKREHDKIFSKISSDFEREHKRLVSLPLNERARIMRLPNIVWAALVPGKLMPPEVEEQIITAQGTYFVQHPNMAYASPTVYRRIIETHMPTDAVAPITRIAAQSILKFADSLLWEDLQLARRSPKTS